MTAKTYIPTFDQNRVLYKRKEKDGYQVLVNNRPTTPDHFKLINNTTQQIIDLCDGKKRIEDICMTLAEVYPQVDKRELTEDVSGAIFLLDQAGFIKWQNNNSPFMPPEKSLLLDQVDDFKLTKAYLGNVSEIIKVVYKALGRAKEDSHHMLMMNNRNIINENRKMYYSKILTEHRIINSSEVFYLLRDKENTIVGVVSYYVKHGQKLCSTLQLVCIDKSLDSEKIQKFLQRVCSDVENFSYKVKVPVSLDNELTKILTEVCQCEKYAKEGIISIIYNDNDVEIYSKINK